VPRQIRKLTILRTDPYDALNNYQTLLRIHPDGGTPGSHGCPALEADAKTLKEFRKAFNEHVKEYGPIPVEVKGSGDSKSVYELSTPVANYWDATWGNGGWLASHRTSGR
jgi:hypothetical protein